jgi:dTDP-4-dehydrorhamnose reductase
MSARPRLLLTGASGTIGRTLRRELADAYDIVGWAFSNPTEGLAKVDLGDAKALAAAFGHAKPDFLVHAAAIGAPDEAEMNPASARRINVDATAALARHCRKSGARMIHFSSDLVFDGEQGNYREEDPVNPINVYARTKADSERLLFELCPGAAALRVALVYGWAGGGRPTFLDQLNSSLARREPVNAFTDQIRTPTPLAGIAEAVRRLLPRTDVTGALHCTGPNRVTRLEFVREFCRVFEYPQKLVVPCMMADVPLPAPRPRDTSLNCDRMAKLLGLHLPGLTESLLRLKLELAR